MAVENRVKRKRSRDSVVGRQENPFETIKPFYFALIFGKRAAALYIEGNKSYRATSLCVLS